MSISIYIHIPFCASKCKYCDFYSAPATEETRNSYVAALINQINSAESTNEEIRSVYFGGGTPSVLSEKQLTDVMEAIDRKFNVSKAERTLEVNPDSVWVAKSLSPIWFNRFSMGVQSFNDEELKLLGRRHTSEEAVKAYEFLRGFADNINLDLMIGLPSKDHEKNLEKSLDKLLSLNPTHSSVYILKYEEGTPIFKMIDSAMDDEKVSDLYLYVSERMTEAGYEHYEISNFARDGLRSVHNFAYWEQKPYLAFGTGAYGFDGKNRYHFEKNLTEYISKNGLVPKITDETLDGDSLNEEKIMLGLRTSDGIDRALYSDILMNARKKALCQKLLKENLARLTSTGAFALTPKGWLVSNEIIEELV